MNLVIVSKTKTIFGLWEVSARVNGKKYDYELAEYGYNLAMQHYRANRYINCLAVLNKFGGL